MLKIITNSKGSGDWIVVLNTYGTVIYQGHSINHRDLYDILKQVIGEQCELREVTDDEIMDLASGGQLLDD